MADRGLLYEQVVRKSISDAASNISTLKIHPDTGGAYDSTVVDICDLNAGDDSFDLNQTHNNG